jgi:hypothetical protein
MLNQRVVSLPGLDNDRLLTNAQHLERALDEWHESGLDTSSDVLALQAFANRWRKSAMLIALRALRRVEDLRLVEEHAAADASSAVVAVDASSSGSGVGGGVQVERKSEKKRLSTPEYYEQAIADWAASGLDTSTNANDFSVFATKWRATATLIALRADRRVDQLRTLEAHGRELEVRQLLAAEAQRQKEDARVVEAERAFQRAQQAARETGDNNAASALSRVENEVGDWSGRGLDKSAKANDLAGFAAKWRQDSTLVALGAERRVDHLRALEFDARGGRVRTGTAADRRPVAKVDTVADQEDSHQEGMAAASAQAAAASFAYGHFDAFEPVAAARPLMDRTYSVTENFNFALDDWQNADLDDSTDIAAFQAFVVRWKNDATLIALRAERRIEALKKLQTTTTTAREPVTSKGDAAERHLEYIARNPIDLKAVEQAATTLEVPPRTSAENIELAVREWDAAALEFSGDRAALAAFSDRWRRDAEIISLRADRRTQELNAEKLKLDPDWQIALRANTVAAYEAFQAKHPHSQYQKELAKRLLLIDDEQAWLKTAALGTIDGYRSYLQAWPSGAYNREARVGMMGGVAGAVGAPATQVPVVPTGVVPHGGVPTGGVALLSAKADGPAAEAKQASAAAPVVALPLETTADIQASPKQRAAVAPRRTALVWLTVLAVAAAGALLAYLFVPKLANVAGAHGRDQMATVGVSYSGGVTHGGGVVAGADHVAGSLAMTEQFRPPVAEPIPDTKIKSAVGPAATPAPSKPESSLSVSDDLSATIASISPLNDSNVATAAHAGWSVRLSPLNHWNVATAAHAGWSVRLPPLNDWNVATAAHAGWPVRLPPLDHSTSATALPYLESPDRRQVLAPSVSVATDQQLISTASIPLFSAVKSTDLPLMATTDPVGAKSRTRASADRSDARGTDEPVAAKPRVRDGVAAEPEVRLRLLPKSTARPAPEPEPEPEAKPRPVRPVIEKVAAPKVETARKDPPAKDAVKEAAKVTAVKSNAPNSASQPVIAAGSPSWLRDIFVSRN